MSAAPVVFAHAPLPAPARPRLLLIGTAFASAAVVMVFGGLLATYLAIRADVVSQIDPATGEHLAWLPSGVTIALTPGTMGLITLVLSAVIVQWAVYAIGNDDRPSAYIALGLTAVMGFAYIVEVAYYLTQIGVSVVDESGFGVLLFSIVGAHIAMIGAAMVFVGLMAFRTLGGQYSGRDREGVAAAALFWHVTVAVYAAIWYAIFVTK